MERASIVVAMTQGVSHVIKTIATSARVDTIGVATIGSVHREITHVCTTSSDTAMTILNKHITSRI